MSDKLPSLSDELISINVWLASRSYRIRIRKEEEEAVRRSIKQADEKIAELRVHYAGKDDQDFIAMCLLMYASDHATDPLEHPALQSELNSILQQLDKVLKEDS